MTRKKAFPWLLAAFFVLVGAVVFVLWPDQPSAAISATATVIIVTLLFIALVDLVLIAWRIDMEAWEITIPDWLRGWVGGYGRCLIPASFAVGIPLGHIFWH